jgi:tRNA (guanine37-N1)-methyltransferase
MRIDVVSLFPAYLDPLHLSLLGKAQEQGIIQIAVHDLRDWAVDPHRNVDDTPYGGGPGMVMSPVVWGEALDSIRDQASVNPVLVIPTPSGQPFDQVLAAGLANEDHLVFACGRYEGIDSRVEMHYSASDQWQRVREISIGDYVLAGGEVATLVMIEAITRLVSGVLGNPHSVIDDSFSRLDSLIEGPVFTKPPNWRGLEVPEVLRSGHHGLVDQWRQDQAKARTEAFRPDLLPDSPRPEH